MSARHTVAVRAEILARLLREHSALPVPRRVDLSSGWAGLSVQMDTAAEVAAWAAQLGGEVVITDRNVHCDVRALIAVGHTEMQVWAPMTHSRAFRLLHTLGHDLSRDGTALAASVLAEHV